jgi:drug/metabolite transporter (DMT)-like permease
VATGLSTPPPVVISSTVLEYRPAGSADDSSRETLRHVQQAFVFFGLLGFAVGCFGGCIGNSVAIPDSQRTLGALMLLGCAMGYVAVRAINSTTRTAPRVVLSLSSAGVAFGAALACAFRFPHRPLQNPDMLLAGLAVLVVGLVLFASTRAVMKRPADQSFEK